MINLRHGLRLVCVGVAFCFGSAQAKPLYPLNREPYVDLAMGSAELIWRDWNEAESEFEIANRPDRSLKNIWVRVFPLLSAPLGDPYPETQNKNSVSLSHPAGLKIYALSNQALLGQGTAIAFDFAAQKILIGSTQVSLQAVWIQPVSADTTLAHWDKGRKLPNGKSAEVRARYRGGFVVQPSTHLPRNSANPQPVQLWSLVNVVGVNDYLKSVVPSEVLAGWANETLKAQGIAARTYAMYETMVSRSRGYDFDVDPSTWYQSYQGRQFWDRNAGAWRTVELTSTTNAVAATGGQVILHNNEVIKSFFSSNSGGRSCLATECLENEPVNPPYIHEVNDHPGIQSAPGGTWGNKATLTSANILAKLKSYGMEVTGKVAQVEHAERGPSGRTWRLRLRMTDGRVIELDRYYTKKVMHLFGPLRSFQYELGSVQKDGKQKVRGHGYGHAVGMSQWGAQLFAKQGWSAAKILQHFYKNVVIRDLSGGRFQEQIVMDSY